MDASFPPLGRQCPRTVVETVGVSLLCALYAVVAVSSQWNKTVTYDEPFYITGGYTYWKFGDFRIQPENGNLPQRWVALPLLLRNYCFPSFDDPDWRTSQKDRICTRFLFETDNDGISMLRQSRAMITLVGLAVVGVVWWWTRRLLGRAAAFVSLTVCVFCPTMIAHGGLATSDMTTAFFFLAGVACIWHVLHRVTFGSVLGGSAIVAGLFLSKFSAPVLVLMGLVLLFIHLASPAGVRVVLGDRRWHVRSRLRRVALHLSIAAIFGFVTWAAIWAAYGFRFSMFAPDSVAAGEPADAQPIDRPQYQWDTVAPLQSDAANWLIRSALRHRLLPEAYLFGGAATRHFASGRAAYMNGHFSRRGWALFFPYCLAVKTPLPLWILIGMGCWAVVRFRQHGDTSATARLSWAKGLYRTAPLWVLFLVYWVIALVTPLNIGHRHLLPTYPVMFILAGAAALWLCPAPLTPASAHQTTARWERFPRLIMSLKYPWRAAIVAGSLGLFATESLLQWPNYLAYFNPLAGGTKHAYRHLVDSSLDWGQDLPALSRWLAEQGLDETPERVSISYFGTGDPGYHGIKARLLPCYWPRAVPQFVPRPLTPGVYCISATMLQQVYSLFPGRWRTDYEKKYRRLGAAVARYLAAESDPATLASLVQATGGRTLWLDVFARYEHARFAKLCSWLQERQPIANINGTILIYRLTAADIDLALESDGVVEPSRDR